jgi:hypothetical protein
VDARRVFEFRLDRQRRFSEIRRMLPSLVFQNPIDMQFGPDGALYVLEYGDGYFSENPAAQLARVDFLQGNYTPVPVVTADVAFGSARSPCNSRAPARRTPTATRSPWRGISTPTAWSTRPSRIPA